MKKKYFAIQEMRGVLFLFILAFHSEAPFAAIGWGGVEAFFVLSAFFLMEKFLKLNTIKFKEQFLHRIKRLYPGYLFVILVAVCYSILRIGFPYDLPVHLLLIQNFLWMATSYSSPMQPFTAHTWTLSIDIFLSVFFMAIIKLNLKRKHIKKMLICTIICSTLFRIYSIFGNINPLIITLCPLGHLDSFALGLLLAINMEEKRKKSIYIVGLIGILGIVISTCIIATQNRVDFWNAYLLFRSAKAYFSNVISGNISLYLAMTFYFIIMCQKERKVIDGTIKKKLVTLGDYSYELYLFHWPTLVIIRYMIHQWYFVFLLTFLATGIEVYIFELIKKYGKMWVRRSDVWKRIEKGS